jgi:hypothetical protein
MKEPDPGGDLALSGRADVLIIGFIPDAAAFGVDPNRGVIIKRNVL